MPQKLRLAAVFLAALLALGFNLRNVGIASGFIDPVTHLGAQDEALYTREAIHMATEGRWLTPVYLGRFVLFKPPLLMWLSGLSMKLFGIEPLTARIPALLAGALICTIVFGIVAKARSLPAACAAVLLLVSNQLFHTLSRLNMTDILLTACVVSAFAFWLRNNLWGFSISTAAAIMTKSVAGVLPMAAIAVCIILHRGDRQEWKRFAQSSVLVGAMALPWHLYQLIAHQNWFLAEYVGVQLMVFGARPPQTSQENQLWFYVVRLFTGDPVLMLVFLFSLPALVLAWRKRKEPLATLLLAWLFVFSAALFVFQYRSVQYTLPFIPALAIVSAVYSPVLSRRTESIAVSLLALFLAVKAMVPGKTWSVSFASGNTLASANSFSDYCAKRRPAELIVLLPEDEFYSSVLPLPRLRYAWIDATDVNARREPHLRYLGITLTPAQFANLPRDRDMYRKRLKSWGVDSAEPVGTAVVAHDLDDLKKMIVTHTESDYFLPRFLLDGIQEQVLRSYAVMNATADRIFLLTNHPSQALVPRKIEWTCEM